MGCQRLPFFVGILVPSNGDDEGFRLFDELGDNVRIAAGASELLALRNFFEEDMNWLCGVEWCVDTITKRYIPRSPLQGLLQARTLIPTY